MKGEEEYSSASLRSVSTPILGFPDRPAKPQEVSNKSTKLNGLGGLNTTPAASGRKGSKADPSTLMPLEYSPIRHRSAIERVLSALQGADPLLDSATKVWTTFAVAKNFEIIHGPLEDYIIRWLRAYPNSYFLEVLPEVSHQIAHGLQNYDLARDSFAILVGEEALDSLRHDREPRLHKHTTFGRKKEDLPEHIHTRVEYASKSFLERMNNDFADFVANGMQWIDELPEVRRLSAYSQPQLQDTVYKLKNLLKDYVRGSIHKILCADYDTVPGPDLHHEGGYELLPRLARAAVWNNMLVGERILSRTFWEALRSCVMFQGVSNLEFHHGWNFKGGFDQLSHIEKRQLVRGTYREVKDSSLRALVRNGQTYLDQAYSPEYTRRNDQQDLDGNSLSRQLHALPDRTIDGTHDQKQPWDLPRPLEPDKNLYSAQRESNVNPLPRRSYALPDRTLNDAQDIALNRKASISTPAQPIDVPKPPKRTQDFHDALSPPDDKQSEIDVRTKWPFGAARDDPVVQVLKSVDGLHVSSSQSDRRPAADNALRESEGQGFENKGESSEHLNWASKTLRRLAPKIDLTIPNAKGEKETVSADRTSWRTDDWNQVQQQFASNPHLTPTKAAIKRAAPKESDSPAKYNDSDGDDGFQQQIEDSWPKEKTFAAKFFDLGTFFYQAQRHIETFARDKLRSSDYGCRREPLDLGIVNTLVCLEDSEWKYLELWAGGNDDGSNGVYNDDLPTAEHGFTTAGPEVHDGTTPINSVKAPSEFELVSAGDSASTFNASTATNRGFSDTIRRGHVHAADSTEDSVSDSFTMVTPSVDSDDEETFARKEIEAQERIEEAEAAATNEARRIANEKGKMVEEDESYADLFSGEEEDDGNDTDRAEFNDEHEEDDEDMVMV